MSEAFALTPVRTVTARLVPYDWAWARDNAGFVAENWARRRAACPAMFDGRVLLARACDLDGEVCTVSLFETAYSNFIGHRDAGLPDGSVANAFAAIVAHGSDGAVLLGEMSVHTANAGQIYFPCGTPDPADIRANGVVDLAGSAAREFTEETGLDLPPEASEHWLFGRSRGLIAFLRPVVFPAPSDVLHERMERHRRSEAEPELAGFVVVRGSGDLDASRMPSYVHAYMAQAFATA